MAGSTGFEPATSGLTVQCANQAAPRPRAENLHVYATGVNGESPHFAKNFALLALDFARFALLGEFRSSKSSTWQS